MKYLIRLWMALLPVLMCCGTYGAEPVTREFPTLNITEWKGQKFIFLPKSPANTDSVYSRIEGGMGKDGHPTRAEVAGKTATVVGVQDRQLRDFTVYTVQLRLDGTTKVYTATGSTSARMSYVSIDGIAPADDILRTKARWAGKTLWLNDKSLESNDPKTGETKFKTIGRLAPVRVMDVIPGCENKSPVRFVLRSVTGENGYVDVAMSNTNRSDSSDHAFADIFFTEDPRKTHQWPEEVWTAIEKRTVTVGMSPDQVRLAMKWPGYLKAEDTGENWLFADTGSSTTITFANGVVKTVLKTEKKPGAEDADEADLTTRTARAALHATPAGVWLLHKGFKEMDVAAGDASDQITFSLVFYNNSKKEIRAIRGTLAFSDIFDKPILSAEVTHDEPLKAGKSSGLQEFSVRYNQFRDADRRLKATEGRNLVTRWVVKEVIYSDGTRETIQKE